MYNKFKTAQMKSKGTMLVIIGSSSKSVGLLLIPLKSQSIHFICKIH